MVQKKRTKRSQWQVRVYRHLTRVREGEPPSRVGPAMSDFSVEPFPLAYWKLDKSFIRTSSVSPLFPPRLRCFVQNIRSLPLSAFHRNTCYTIVAFLVIPSASVPESFNQDARIHAAKRFGYYMHDGLLVFAVVHTARRRHSRSESPELLGRIVFFITAVGRSPPA
jgi:hypothetical protein